MKDRTILALKGLAIIGVVLHHVSNRRLEPHVIDWIHIAARCFTWCVMAFLCVSGYLQALSDSRKTRSILEFAQVRFWRLLVPFFVLVVFYSCVWQMIQALHVPNIGTHVPPDFLGKLEQGLWPIDSWVAQQLYYFPLLFGISMVLVIVQRDLGLWGLWAAALLGGGFGLAYFPTSFTGFSWGVFLWGISFYAIGYLLFHYRADKNAIRVALFLLTALLVVASRSDGLLRSIPLWLLAEGSTLRLDRIPVLDQIGDASGTIYIYHSPFIILPLVIATTYLHGAGAQFIGILLAVTIAIAICCLVFEGLKNTRAKVLLM